MNSVTAKKSVGCGPVGWACEMCVLYKHSEWSGNPHTCLLSEAMSRQKRRDISLLNIQCHLRHASLSNVPLLLFAKVRVLTMVSFEGAEENRFTFVNEYIGGSSHVFRGKSCYTISGATCLLKIER